MFEGVLRLVLICPYQFVRVSAKCRGVCVLVVCLCWLQSQFVRGGGREGDNFVENKSEAMSRVT